MHRFHKNEDRLYQVNEDIHYPERIETTIQTSGLMVQFLEEEISVRKGLVVIQFVISGKLIASVGIEYFFVLIIPDQWLFLKSHF